MPIRQGLNSQQQHLSNVIIAGHIPEGAAYKVRDKLKIGNVIRLMDGQEVNLVFKLTVQCSPYTGLLISGNQQSQQPPDFGLKANNLSTVLQDSYRTTSKTIPCTVLYLTRFIISLKGLKGILFHCDYFRSGVMESSPEMADVLYQFPPSQIVNEHLQPEKILQTRAC